MRLFRRNAAGGLRNWRADPTGSHPPERCPEPLTRRSRNQELDACGISPLNAAPETIREPIRRAFSLSGDAFGGIGLILCHPEVLSVFSVFSVVGNAVPRSCASSRQAKRRRDASPFFGPPPSTCLLGALCGLLFKTVAPHGPLCFLGFLPVQNSGAPPLRILQAGGTPARRLPPCACTYMKSTSESLSPPATSAGRAAGGNCVAARRGGEQPEADLRSQRKLNPIRPVAAASPRGTGEASCVSGYRSDRHSSSKVKDWAVMGGWGENAGKVTCGSTEICPDRTLRRQCRAEVRAAIVAMKRGNARGAKGGRKVGKPRP